LPPRNRNGGRQILEKFVERIGALKEKEAAEAAAFLCQIRV
jgi:hypothetical protein